MKTGLTERTIKNLQLNAGVLLKSYTKGGAISESNIIGATRGGGTFSAVPTIHQVSVDGSPVYVKGLERVDEWVVTLAVSSFLEFTPESLSSALAVAVKKESVADGTKLTCSRTVAAGDYQDLYWVGDTSDGKNIVIHLKNCLNLTGLVITQTDKGEGTYPVTYTAHYDAPTTAQADFETAPFDIIFEDTAEA